MKLQSKPLLSENIIISDVTSEVEVVGVSKYKCNPVISVKRATI